MQKKSVMLAALSAANEASFTPVQIQKLFFLLDKKIPQEISGPLFDFQPYDYGPFDKAVYRELDELEQMGLVETLSNGRWREYRLTTEGQYRGQGEFQLLPKRAQDYIVAVVHFVRSLSFSELVRSIYAAYPEMAVNSVFQK